MADRTVMTTVQLDSDTRDLLGKLAEMDLRSMTQELKYLVMEQARLRGMLELQLLEETEG